MGTIINTLYTFVLDISSSLLPTAITPAVSVPVFWTGGVLLFVGEVWLLVELLFCIYFHVVLIPKANEPYQKVLQQVAAVTTRNTRSSSSSSSPKSPSCQQSKKFKNPYREPYHIHKHLLLRRILYRLLNDTVAITPNMEHDYNKNEKEDEHHESSSSTYDPVVVQQVMTDFILSWFHSPPPPTSSSSSSSLTSSSNTAATTAAATPTLLIHHQNPNERPPQKLQLQSSNVSSLSEETGTTQSDTTTIHNSSSSSNKRNSRHSTASSSSSDDGSRSVTTTTTTTVSDSAVGGIEEDTGSISSTEEILPPPPPSMKTTTTKTTTTKTTPPSLPNATDWTIPQISKSQMNDFLAWSMFNQHMDQMTGDDLVELQKCYQELHQVVQLVFYDEDDNNDETDDVPTQKYRLSSSSSIPSCDRTYDTSTSRHPDCSSHNKSSTKPAPRRLCLEYVNAWHRPLFIYLIVSILRTILTRWILQYGLGFQRVHSQQVPGVTGWYRPSHSSLAQSRIPMIFFHGIAPAGVFFYLPMLLWGSDILTRDRCCLLVDNYNIACTLMFDAKSEQEMVLGVQDLIDTYFPNPATTPIAVCGHSFGSCVISWLFYHGSAQLQKQIQLCVLLDPVTILLSDPNVMNNFLYSHKVWCCIRMFASSELFTEYYLRHHFSWYNSELWLDEILPGLSVSEHADDDGKIRHVIVGLSECDEIVDAPKVKRHIDLFLQRQQLGVSSNPQQQHHKAQRQSLRTMFWKQAGHANCLQSPSKWQDIQHTIRECEYTIAQQQPSIQ